MEGLLSMGQVRPIINQKDCIALARHIVKKGLSVRQVEALVKKVDGSRMNACAPKKSANIRDLEKKASNAIGVNVTIEWDEIRDNGSVHLKNCSHDQLENILVKLGVM